MSAEGLSRVEPLLWSVDPLTLSFVLKAENTEQDEFKHIDGLFAAFLNSTASWKATDRIYEASTWLPIKITMLRLGFGSRPGPPESPVPLLGIH